MKKINGYFAPDTGEIKKAIKEARSYALSTGNSVQLWFDTVSGEFCKEEFVDSNSHIVLPDYCYNVGMIYGDEVEIAAAIEQQIRGEQT